MLAATGAKRKPLPRPSLLNRPLRSVTPREGAPGSPHSAASGSVTHGRRQAGYNGNSNNSNNNNNNNNNDDVRRTRLSETPSSLARGSDFGARAAGGMYPERGTKYATVGDRGVAEMADDGGYTRPSLTHRRGGSSARCGSAFSRDSEFSDKSAGFHPTASRPERRSPAPRDVDTWVAQAAHSSSSPGPGGYSDAGGSLAQNQQQSQEYQKQSQYHQQQSGAVAVVAVGARDNDPSSYRARRRRRKFHDPRKGAAKIFDRGGGAEVHREYAERRSDFDRNRAGWSAVNAKDAIFPDEGCVGAIGEVPPPRPVTLEDMFESRAVSGGEFRANLDKARATRAKEIIFSQAESGVALNGRPGASTPQFAAHRVSTPQTRSIPKVFRAGPVDQEAGLEGLRGAKMEYQTNKETSASSRVRDIIAPPGQAGGVDAVPDRKGGVAVAGRRRGCGANGRESPATRSIPVSLRDPGARFSRREIARNVAEQRAAAAVNREFGKLSEIPSVFAHWSEISPNDPVDPFRTETPPNARVHRQTPTSRTVPKSLRAPPPGPEERRAEFNDAQRARMGNREKVRNTTIAGVFRFDAGGPGAAPDGKGLNIGDEVTTVGMPVPDEKLAKKGREDARKLYLANRGRTFKRDINLFEWSGAESSDSGESELY